MAYQEHQQMGAGAHINSDEEPLTGPVSSAGITLSRLLLTLFNAVLILFGTILVIVGISAHNHLNNYIELVGPDNINRAALRGGIFFLHKKIFAQKKILCKKIVF